MICKQSQKMFLEVFSHEEEGYVQKLLYIEVLEKLNRISSDRKFAGMSKNLEKEL